MPVTFTFTHFCYSVAIGVTVAVTSQLIIWGSVAIIGYFSRKYIQETLRNFTFECLKDYWSQIILGTKGKK